MSSEFAAPTVGSSTPLTAEVVGTAEPVEAHLAPAVSAPIYTAAVVTTAITSPPPQPPSESPTTAPAANETAADDETADEARPHLSQTAWRGIAAALVSTVVHCAVLIVLGLMIVPNLAKPVPKVIQATIEERPLEEVVQRLQTDMRPATQIAPSSSAPIAGSGVQGAKIAAAVAPPKLNTTVVNRFTSMRVDVGAVNVLTASGSSLAAAVPQGTLGEALTTADGYGEAMDILTREILNRLARGKVLVVWMFDQSLSMKDDQREIRDRLDKVYAELDLSSAVKGDALWTAVVSYGKGFAVHTQRPTNLIDDIRKAIDAVPVDESGEEMMCTAVGQTVAAFRQFTGTGGGRQMMLVLVSDESGNQNDNAQNLEPAIALCKDARAAVYVLGREAVFGYPFAHMNWPVTLPAVGGGTITRNFVVPVDRGPESAFVEQLQTEGFHRRTDAHPSGFGPYEQVRLARETGGMFLMLPTPESAVFRRDATQFTLEHMRPYLPDLRSREEYAKERDYNPTRVLVWKVINDLNPYKPEIARYIDMRLTFAADRAEFARQVDVELAKAKQYVVYLDAAEKALRDAKPFRAREKSPRWRAHYDLTLAQVVAYKARIFEYGAYLTAFKSNPTPTDPPRPHRVLGRWEIRERGRPVAGKITQPLIDDATNMFKLITAEYLGTPWATRAQYELGRGFGVELVPIYVDPDPPPGRRPVRPFTPPRI